MQQVLPDDDVVYDVLLSFLEFYEVIPARFWVSLFLIVIFFHHKGANEYIYIFFKKGFKWIKTFQV